MKIVVLTLLAIGLSNGAMAVDGIKPDDKPWWSQEVTDCDRQASHGDDPWHVAPDVARRDMDFDKAIAACSEALKRDPENPRLNYQLGRLYGYSGQWQKGMPSG